jgi:hypothetical protein
MSSIVGMTSGRSSPTTFGGCTCVLATPRILRVADRSRANPSKISGSVRAFFLPLFHFPFASPFFVSSYLTLNIGSPNNESLLVNTCSTWFSVTKLHLSNHHILPSKLHLLLSRTYLTLLSPHTLLIITRPSISTYCVSRTLIKVE